MQEQFTLFNGLKACSKCGETLPFTIGYFYAEPRNNSGLTGKCRECFKDQSRRWLEDNHEYASDRTRRYRETNRAYVLALEKASRERHREAKVQRDRAYYQNNREALQQKMRDYYYANHEERLRKQREWGARNVKKVSEYSARKRARMRLVVVGEVCYATLLEAHGMVCHICGGEIRTKAELHMDHVVPLIRGGEHSMENIRPSHGLCNMRKGVLTMEEFRESQG